MVAITTIPTNETAPANAIYVSVNGSSTAAGTEAAPCSLQAGINKANATGSTIVLTGVSTQPYRVGALSLSKSIRFIAKGGDSPVLSGAKTVALSEVITETSTGLFYINHSSTLGDIRAEHIDPNYPQAGNRQQLFVNNVYYKQVATKGALVPLSFFYQRPTSTAGGRIYIKDDVRASGTKIELINQNEAVQFNAGSAGTTFVGVGFERYGNGVGLCQEDNVTFDRCSFYHFSFFAINSQYNDNLRVKGCKFAYTGSNAIKGGAGSRNWIIEDNDITYSNYANFSNIYNAAGMKIMNSHSAAVPVIQNFIIRRNKVSNTNRAPNIWLDIMCTGYQVYDNECSKGSMGIFFEISGHPNSPSYIVNNYCYDNGFGIFTSHSQDCYIYNNVCRNNSTNFKFKDDNRVQDNADQATLGYDYNSRNIRYVNNINDTSRSSSGSLVDGTSVDTRMSTAMVSEMHHNAYYRSTATQSIYKNWNKETFATLTDFRADPANEGYENESIGRTAESSNPYFVDNTSTVTKSTSPTKGKGAAVSGVVASILGVAPGTVVDIGNVRFLGKTTAQPEPPAEPVDPCATAVEDATAELQTQLGLATDTLRATELQLQSMTAERDTAIEQKNAAVASESTLRTKAVEDLSAVKLFVEQKLLTYQ